MKIALGVFGRFHIFDLARQLSDKRVLNQFFTSYPKFLVEKWEIAANKNYSYPIIETLNRIHYKGLNKYFSNIYLRRWFDYLISKRLASDNDIYHCWGGSINSIIRAHEFQMPVIFDQGSTHVLYAQDIREEECRRSGIINTDRIPQALIKRELAGYQMADYICVPSSFVKNSFLSYGIHEKKLLVNPYGVNLASFNSIPKKDNIFRVIFVGSICIRKGCHYLLQAFHELNMANSELHMIGPVNRDMHSFLNLYSGPKIKLLGVKNQSELYKYYSQGSVFVMMSIEEGLAMVQLQAMSCGLPLICSENTGVSDLISDGIEGFIIPIRDVNLLKARLDFLYNNENIREEMGKKALLKAKVGFKWEDYGNRMVNFYTKILNT